MAPADTPAPSRPCTGRFAPSPTGPLHFGSVVAAVGSFLEARRHGGRWLVRMEDLDPPREVPGAADDILRTLDALGLHWDGEVLYQSRRHEAYAEALARLQAGGRLYGCACSRREVAEASAAAGRPGVYPGTCRNGVPGGRAPRALRLRVDGETVGFADGIQGRVTVALAETVGDFVVRRADGLFAYHLAVVVDDAAQGVTQVVRGADLLGCTPAQIRLQNLLGLPVPAYAHLPVAVNAAGEKLSKQTGARPVDTARPGVVLVQALDFLGQDPPAELAAAPAAEVLAWALAHWDPARVPRAAAAPAPG